MKNILRFFKEARAELKRVSWPSWNDVTRSTWVVLITIIFFTLFIFLADEAIGSIIQRVLG